MSFVVIVGKRAKAKMVQKHAGYIASRSTHLKICLIWILLFVEDMTTIACLLDPLCETFCICVCGVSYLVLAKDGTIFAELEMNAFLCFLPWSLVRNFDSLECLNLFSLF